DISGRVWAGDGRFPAWGGILGRQDERTRRVWNRISSGLQRTSMQPIEFVNGWRNASVLWRKRSLEPGIPELARRAISELPKFELSVRMINEVAAGRNFSVHR